MPASRLVLGKHSGRHALKDRAETLGHTLSKAELDELYDLFTHVADNKKGLRNDEIARLIEKVKARQLEPAAAHATTK